MPDAPDLHEYTVRTCTPAQLDELIDLGRLAFSPSFEKKRYRKIHADMQEQPFFQDTGYVAWALVRRDDPDGQGYSYVETFPRKATIKTKEGIKEATVYGVTFVHTPKHLRRKGYSRRLLRCIHYILNPSTGWPEAFGPSPEIPPNVKVVPGIASYLSSVAPNGFYEAATIGVLPNENGEERQGWVQSEGSANGLLTLPVPELNLSLGKSWQDEWTWDWIYQKNYTSLQPGLQKAMLRELEATSVNEGETVLRVDPINKGVLGYLDWHLFSAMNMEREPLSASTIVGVRYFRHNSESIGPNGEEAKSSTQWKDTDPLVLFLPGGHKKNELTLSLTVNIIENPTVLPAMMASLSSICAENGFDTIALFGRGKDDKLVTMLEENYSATWEDRKSAPYLPNGVAWYGENGKGEGKVRFEGLELWAFV